MHLPLDGGLSGVLRTGEWGQHIHMVEVFTIGISKSTIALDVEDVFARLTKNKG